jgi:WS/DGAT C-terminal domain
MRKATVYVSNLQGPRQRIAFGGVEVTDMFNVVSPSQLAFVLSGTYIL